MNFEQTTRRERILIYGSYKLGKSTCWIDIADAYHKSGNTDIHFYIVDTDFGAWKLLDEGYQHLIDAEMLTIYNPDDFSEMLADSKAIYRKARRGDWIVIDMIEYGWSEAQRFYTQGVFGEEPENYFLQMRKEVVAKGGKDKRAFGGFEGTDWNFISKIYTQWEFPLSMKSPANVLAIASERKLDADRGDSTDKLKQYKNVGGMAPVGQKGIGHRFDTVLRMTRRANGQRQITMAGDRGRQKTAWAEHGSNTIDIGEGREGFARRYLVDVAGWKAKDKKDGKTATKSLEGESSKGVARRRPATRPVVRRRK